MGHYEPPWCTLRTGLQPHRHESDTKRGAGASEPTAALTVSGGRAARNRPSSPNPLPESFPSQLRKGDETDLSPPARLRMPVHRTAPPHRVHATPAAAGRHPATPLRQVRRRAPRTLPPLHTVLGLLLGASLLAGASALSAQAGPDAAERARLAGEVDRIMAELDRDDAPGAIVAWVYAGEVAVERAYGMADLTHAVALTPRTPSNIGSTAKQFTAYAVARLAAEGRLALDDDVRRWLPELPELDAPVTLRHLLTHTSGYREFLNALAVGGWLLEEADFIEPREAFRVVERQPRLQNAPGSEWNYNNTGYVLLAHVIEAATDEPFAPWMRANVFGPLGMDSTWIRSHPGDLVPGRTQGYTPLGGSVFRETADIGGAVGAGAVYTTAGDLARWMGHLARGTAEGASGPEAEALREMTTRYVLSTGDTVGYGLGLELGTERGLRRVSHGGGDRAHRSHFAWYPELDQGLIVISNRGGLPGRVIGELTELFFGEAMEAPVAAAAGAAVAPEPAGVDLAPERFDEVAGRYELEAAPGFVLRFYREGDRFMTQATGQPAFELTATSDSTFVLSVVEAGVTFHRDAEGRVTGLSLHQNGNHPARRLEETASEIDLAPFAGRYFSEEFESVYTIAVEGGRLVAQHRRRGPVRLEQSGDDLFSGAFPLLQVRFERDEAGEVTGFRASAGRARDMWFGRIP